MFRASLDSLVKSTLSSVQLWPEKVLCKIQIIWNSPKLVPWPRILSHLTAHSLYTWQCLHSSVVGCSALWISVKVQSGWYCCPDPLYGFRISCLSVLPITERAVLTSPPVTLGDLTKPLVRSEFSSSLWCSFNTDTFIISWLSDSFSYRQYSRNLLS